MTRENSAFRLAGRMADIQPFFVMEVQARAFALERAGRKVVHMEIGQPDFGAPPPVLAAVNQAFADHPLGYTDALGLAPLRERIAEFYRARYRVAIEPERIIVTLGASGAFLLAVGTLFDPGDEILMPDPCYPCNRYFARMFEARARTIAVGPDTRYQLTPGLVARDWTERTRGAVVATPSNPTGTCVPPDDLAAIARLVAARGGHLIVDEIYQSLRYDDAEQTALAVAPDAFVINSFSKYFSMTGWRIGWIVAPRAAVRGLERFAQNAFICPSAPAQYAALAALEPDAIAIFEARRAEFQRRRDALLPALESIGFRFPVRPEGAFYLYADCSGLAADSRRFALDALEREGVAFTPGIDFGANLPERYVRFAYTRSLDELLEGVERLRRYVRAGAG